VEYHFDRPARNPGPEEFMLGSFEFALGSLGIGEIVLILLIVILIFGTSRIPELGKGLGEGIKNFKKSVKGEDEGEKKS
jgi:sec-independent protein translocase protein TatA